MSYFDKEIKAEFKGATHLKINAGVIIIREYDEKERNRKMLKIGGFAFLGALFSVFIPILHFILVPGFIIGGAVTAAMAGRATQVHACKVKCPECDKDFVISKGKPNFPKDDYCSSCHHKVIISLA